MTNLAADKCNTACASPVVVQLKKSHLVDTSHHQLNKRERETHTHTHTQGIEWFYGAALVPTQNVIALHSVRNLIKFTEATQFSDGYSNYQPCDPPFPKCQFTIS